MTETVLQTKLYIPPLRPNLVQRPHLIERLNQGLAAGSKLTLVSAPAGFGKSTLLSAWAQQSKPGAHVAWLSLDESDNDLTRFLAYFVTALQTIDSGIGQGILAALQSRAAIDTEVVLTLLINEIAEYPHEVILILDDYHVIESQSVDRVITYFLEHLPLQMHLIIGSRSDPSWPLARLRAREQMIEIRASQLRFTFDEVSDFFNQTRGFNLSVEHIIALEERTEGWITGLQLAALSMQSSDDLGSFVSAFTGSDRYILDYLGEEVLAQQPQGVQMFLLQTSILNRLTGPLCDAVRFGETVHFDEMPSSSEGTAITGGNNGREMLESLERRSLFILPLDNERRWYRYHHLFRDLLKRRLSQAFPQQIIELHQRASIWYQNKGEINEAIHHAMAADNTELAADILEDHWEEFFIRGELAKLKRMLDSLGPKITNNSVPLRMAYCMLYSQTGAIKLIPGHLKVIRRKIEANADNDINQPSSLTVIPSLFETMEAIVALDNDQTSKAKEHAKRAISLIPSDASPLDRRRLFLAASFRLGQAHKELGEADQACSILLEVLEMLKATESYYVVSTVIQVVSMYQELGRKLEARALCEDTLHFITQKHWEELPPVGFIYVALAGLQAEAGDYEVAQENLDKGRRLVKEESTPGIIGMINEIEEKLSNITSPTPSLIDPLSKRELEVLQLVARGLSNREIGERLFLSLSTVKGHNRNIFDKLQVRRRTEAVARARELDLV